MADEERRTFLKLCIHGLGAVFAAVLGVPVVSYLIDPRHRQAAAGEMRPVSGIRLTEITELNRPVQGVIRDVRRDAWTLHPNDVIGRVWVVRSGPGPRDLRVFTTVCPHLGCSINVNAEPTSGFTCPCHNGQFLCDGNRVRRDGYTNPAPRDMDSLEFDIDPENPDQLLVRYVNFKQAENEKIPRT
ncbi:MAG: Rieske 2Fe-2S domain-containing protein [Gemmataceae bacterium]|nr:Rieske 2Fe-2S domain-containing protein [Gemmataceae bacterium]MCI0738348.1 Rieske 2Fe-2S domain-containing protein [Gemmataceae bacterium]